MTWTYLAALFLAATVLGVAGVAVVLWRHQRRRRERKQILRRLLADLDLEHS